MPDAALQTQNTGLPGCWETRLPTAAAFLLPPPSLVQAAGAAQACGRTMIQGPHTQRVGQLNTLCFPAGCAPGSRMGTDCAVNHAVSFRMGAGRRPASARMHVGSHSELASPPGVLCQRRCACPLPKRSLLRPQLLRGHTGLPKPHCLRQQGWHSDHAGRHLLGRHAGACGQALLLSRSWPRCRAPSC